MKPHDEIVRDLVKQWLARAEEDFGLAEYLLNQEAGYLIAIGFHSQQAAEKFLKAFLVLHQVDFRRTHNLGELLDLVAAVDSSLAKALASATTLNPYSVQIRYPTEFPEMTIEGARQALEVAALVRDQVLKAIGNQVV